MLVVCWWLVVVGGLVDLVAVGVPHKMFALCVCGDCSIVSLGHESMSWLSWPSSKAVVKTGSDLTSRMHKAQAHQCACTAAFYGHLGELQCLAQVAHGLSIPNQTDHMNRASIPRAGDASCHTQSMQNACSLAGSLFLAGGLPNSQSSRWGPKHDGFPLVPL